MQPHGAVGVVWLTAHEPETGRVTVRQQARGSRIAGPAPPLGLQLLPIPLPPHGE
jgi:hypothetical protein